MKSMFSSKAVAINELTDRTFTIEQLIKAFEVGFEKGLDVELVPYELTEEQLHEVQTLAKEKYESNEWNYKNKRWQLPPLIFIINKYFSTLIPLSCKERRRFTTSIISLSNVTLIPWLCSSSFKLSIESSMSMPSS